MTCSRCNRLACGASSCVRWKMVFYGIVFVSASLPLHSCARSIVVPPLSLFVPFVPLFTHRAHILTASLQGANRCVGVPPPTPPSDGHTPSLVSAVRLTFLPRCCRCGDTGHPPCIFFPENFGVVMKSPIFAPVKNEKPTD